MSEPGRVDQPARQASSPQPQLSAPADGAGGVTGDDVLVRWWRHPADLLRHGFRVEHAGSAELSLVSREMLVSVCGYSAWVRTLADVRDGGMCEPCLDVVVRTCALENPAAWLP